MAVKPTDPLVALMRQADAGALLFSGRALQQDSRHRAPTQRWAAPGEGEPILPDHVDKR